MGDVLRRHMLEVNTVDAGAPVNIVGHPGWSHDIVEGQGRISPYLRVVRGSAGELPARGIPLPLGIDLLDPLDHLKQPGSTGNAIRLQGRCDRQTDGLFRPIGVGNDEMGFQRIQPPRHAFHRSIKRFEINRDICPLFHSSRLRKVAIWMIPVALYRRYHRFSSEIFAIWATPHRI